MNAFIVFFKKEVKEHIRSYRLLILGIVFVIFGMMSPATARFMPELMKSLGNGIEIKMPPVTVLDSYLQFFKNINSMGIIILLLMFAGLVVDEKTKGSAATILTKHISRTAFLMAKYAAAALLWTVVYWAGALVCQGYTLWLFPDGSASNLVIAFGAYWVFGLLLLAFTLFASAAMPSHGLATLGAFVGWGVLIVSMIPARIAEYSPAVLGSNNLQMITGTLGTDDLLWPLAIAVVLIAALLYGGASLLKKQEL
jgi:ABC-2 type transport system permease protein